MKKLVFVIVTNLIFAFMAFGQSPCPKISVTTPSNSTPLGKYLDFLVNVENTDLDKIGYKWSISEGNIIDGQGNSKIKVATSSDSAGLEITAIIEISGLPQNCPNTASTTVNIIGCGLRRSSQKMDEVSDENPRIHKEILQNLELTLKSEPSAKAFIVETFKKGISNEFIKKKLVITYTFLIQTLKIPAERITWQIYDGSENLTEFWFVPTGASDPDKNSKKIEIEGWDLQNQINKLFPTLKKKSAKPTRNLN